MGTVTIGIATMDEVKRSTLAAFKGERQGGFITFLSVANLMETLTVKRWEIIQAMTGKGPMSVRNVARLVNRDVKAVHGDVQALVQAGVLDKDAKGQVVFPYDAVHVDFTFGRAA
ncbi:MAG TPA: transcriptional regulator [Rhodopila sp.]|nr:transcriptional regulator [Rhodopila sp.]